MVFVEVFRQQGVTVTPEQAREPMGTRKRDHIRLICEMRSVRQQWEAVHGRPPQESDIDVMYEQSVPLQTKSVTEHSALIPGCRETIDALRGRGLGIASTTGYSREIMEALLPHAESLGYLPDVTVCASDVTQGRPAPWMLLECARQLNAYPVESLVKVDDTVPGILAGLHAGAWTVAIAATGNEVGLNLEDFNALDEAVRRERIERSASKLAQAGAHYVIDSIADLPGCIDDIERRLGEGEKP
jgi:phosphonoacetaldehyde hydrolase